MEDGLYKIFFVLQWQDSDDLAFKADRNVFRVVMQACGGQVGCNDFGITLSKIGSESAGQARAVDQQTKIDKFIHQRCEG